MYRIHFVAIPWHSIFTRERGRKSERKKKKRLIQVAKVKCAKCQAASAQFISLFGIFSRRCRRYSTSIEIGIPYTTRSTARKYFWILFNHKVTHKRRLYFFSLHLFLSLLWLFIFVQQLWANSQRWCSSTHHIMSVYGFRILFFLWICAICAFFDL